MKRLLCLILCLFSFYGQTQEIEISGSRKTVRTSGDITAALIPAACLVTTLALEDYEGLKQGAIAGVTTLGLSYALKYLVKKERPDHSDRHSFPSSHSSVSFAGATFLQRRYGWQWGVPAYVVASYTAWSRVYGKKHDVWDVGAGALLGVGCAYLFTTPYLKNRNLSLAPVFSDNYAGIDMVMRF
ncbi:phosphatase PAP2 family protein [Parabacteroides sp. Marseille-P3160]|uniref:phosphatase PAP2 family protein n=1 Tax=Parabacteroides sp. Marseille-P3160 TaxID=1917887 RepID=UPI0009BA92C5|nr:phosphatase PAP2 family protein [Parabacteroides sp. Marseille-P3160]